MKNHDQINQTAMLAGVMGQVGCVTVILIGLALGAGMLLDRLLDTRPIFTILLMIGSVPVTLYVSVRISLTAAARAQRQAQRTTTEEDSAQ